MPAGHRSTSPRIHLKTRSNASEIPAPAQPPMLLSSSNMEHAADSTPLTTIQQCVVNALAAGSTLTDPAEATGVHRVTASRCMKPSQPFPAAPQRARAEFVLARRDD